jgi:hypothetical protein
MITPKVGSDDLKMAMLSGAFFVPVFGIPVLVAFITLLRRRRKEKGLPAETSCQPGVPSFWGNYNAAYLASLTVFWSLVGCAFVGLIGALYIQSSLKMGPIPAEWQALLQIENWEDIILTLVVMSPFAALAALWFWVLRWRWTDRPNEQPAAFYALNWYRQTLSDWRIFISYALCVVALFYSLLETRANAQVDDCILKGERVYLTDRGWPL